MFLFCTETYLICTGGVTVSHHLFGLEMTQKVKIHSVSKYAKHNTLLFCLFVAIWMAFKS